MPFMRSMGSCSLSHTVRLPSACSSMAEWTGMIRGWTVVLRPVELNASRDPWTQQPDQRGLDDVLPVEEVVLVGLVEPGVNPPADLRENHQLNEFVFKRDGL